MTTPWLDDGDVQLYHGDVLETLRALPAGIAQTCITSPPYWGLRDYGTGAWSGGDGDHAHDTEPHRNGRGGSGAPGKQTAGAFPSETAAATCSCGARRVDNQLGLEATPAEYVTRIVSVFREVWRVLRADGTVWLNLGDSYNAHPCSPSTGGFQGQQRRSNGAYEDAGRSYAAGHGLGKTKTLKPKDLVGIPWRVAFALQADGWYLRSDIIWSKPNPMPESVTDRPTKSHEYLFLLTKQPRYFYDADAIREANVSPEQAEHTARYAKVYDAHTERVQNGDGIQPGNVNNLGIHARGGATVGRNRRSVWTIATQPFPEAHFATYPEALVRPCILAGTSEKGECSACGAPWTRVLSERGQGPTFDPLAITEAGVLPDGGVGTHRNMGGRYQAWLDANPQQTVGWRASCTCQAPTRPQLVLDPFIGSGTTAHVARKHGRRSIGIDLSAEYLTIAARRLAQLSLLADVEEQPRLTAHRGLTGGAYSPPGQSPHSNAREAGE